VSIIVSFDMYLFFCYFWQGFLLHCKAQCAAENWTQLGRSVSWVQYSAVHWTLTGDESSQLVAGFRPVIDCKPTIRESVGLPPLLWRTTANFVAESSQVVAGSVHSGKLNST